MLSTLRENALFTNSKTSELFKKEIEYLGHIMFADGVRPDPKKVAMIVAWPVPADLTALRSFLGLAMFYRKYVWKYSHIATPLTDMTQKNKFGEWIELQQASFDKLKQAIAECVTLKIVDLQKPYVVETDASDIVVGAVLMQEGRPVAFESKKLNPA